MQLFESLRVLASEREEQENYLLELGTFPLTDELALQFSDAYCVYKGAIKERSQDDSNKDQCIYYLDQIKLIFDNMSNKSNNDFWHSSFLDKKEWNEVRMLAKHALHYFKNL